MALLPTASTGVGFVDQMQAKSNGNEFSPEMNMNQADFLRLLTTQMMSQDPTQPMDPTSFITDLTQMSQLSASQELNKSVLAMTEGFKSLQVMQAAGMIGRAVVAESDAFDYNEEFASHIALDSDQALTDVKIIISNEKGVIREMSAYSTGADGTLMGYLAKGETIVKWDGLNDDGGEAKSGTYDVLAYGYDANGEIQQIKTIVSTNIYSVNLGDDGSMKLTLSTGKKVDLDKVKEIG